MPVSPGDPRESPPPTVSGTAARPDGTSSRKPFLLLAVRPEDEAADDEYASLLRLSGLAEPDLVRVRLEQGPAAASVAADLAAYRGVILGGGPFQRSDPPERKSALQHRIEADIHGVLAQVLARDLPFLGLCYGIGMVGTHVGGVVDRTYGEPVGRLDVVVTDAGAADPLFAGLPRQFEAFGGHKEALTGVPAAAVVLATSPACPVQAFRVGRNVYATQFHPELDSRSLQTRIEAYRLHGYFAPEEADALKAQARERECPWPAQVLRNFIGRYAG